MQLHGGRGKVNKMTNKIIVNYGESWCIENATNSNWLPDDYACKIIIRYTDDSGCRHIAGGVYAVRFVYTQDWETDFYIALHMAKPLPFSVERQLYNIIDGDTAAIYGIDI